jgi:hypothetical protein
MIRVQRGQRGHPFLHVVHIRPVLLADDAARRSTPA